jgi:hypothetical protein
MHTRLCKGKKQKIFHKNLKQNGGSFYDKVREALEYRLTLHKEEEELREIGVDYTEGINIRLILLWVTSVGERHRVERECWGVAFPQ